MASRMHEYKKTSWELRGATGAQHRHIEQKWQACRELPDRSGPLTGPESVLGLGAFSASDCPLARLRLDSPPSKEEKKADIPIASPRTIDRYKNSFYKYDFEGSGEISTKELRILLEGLGREVSDESVKVIMQQIDTNGSGKVAFTEFLEGVIGLRERRPDDPPPLSAKDKAYRDMTVCIGKDDVEGMRTLLEKWSVHLNPDPATGLEIIHVAARRGCEAMVSLILEMRGDPSKAARDGRTPLHLASESSHPERDRSVVALLAAGASGSARSEQGYTPLLKLVPEQRGSPYEWDHDPGMRERFVEHRKTAHHTHGYHSMLAIADIVGGSRHKHHRRRGDEEDGQRSHSRHRDAEDGHRRSRHRDGDEDRDGRKHRSKSKGRHSEEGGREDKDRKEKKRDKDDKKEKKKKKDKDRSRSRER